MSWLNKHKHSVLLKIIILTLCVVGLVGSNTPNAYAATVSEFFGSAHPSGSSTVSEVPTFGALLLKDGLNCNTSSGVSSENQVLLAMYSNAIRNNNPDSFFTDSGDTLSQKSVTVLNSTRARYQSGHTNSNNLCSDIVSYVNDAGITLSKAGQVNLAKAQIVKACNDKVDNLADVLNGLEDDQVIEAAKHLDEGCNGAIAAGQGTSTDIGIDNCNAEFKNPITWVVCPVIDGLTAATVAMEKVIIYLLTVDTTQIFDQSTPTGEAYFTAWNTFRVFGIVLIVIAGFFMIISQALGLDVFDAYTIKKVLPRLFVAAIAISLSWYLLEFLCNITNDVGQAIRSIIYYPFRDLGQGGLTGGAEALALALGGGALFSLGILGMLSLVGTAALAALVAFGVLVVRQLVIIFLIIISPFAIACYVMPNTERAYKLWWGTLSRTLLMFPIIVGIIAIGHAFAKASYAYSGGGGSTLNSIVALLAYFIPYFLLPFTFRLAGGAIATITGFVNDRSRGSFDRLKTYRGNQSQKNWQAAQAGTRFRGGREGNARGFLNKGIAATTNAPGAISESGSLLRPRNWRGATRARMQSREAAEMERNIKENESAQDWIKNDTYADAALHTSNAAELRNWFRQRETFSFTDENGEVVRDENGRAILREADMEDTITKIQTTRRQMSSQAFKVMAQRQKNAGGTEYRTRDINGRAIGSNDTTTPRTAAGQWLAELATVSRDDDALAGRLVAEERSEAMGSGRVDLGGVSYGVAISAVTRMRQELQSTGTISQQTIEDVSKTVHKNIYSAQGGAALTHSSMKEYAVAEMVPTILEDLETGQAAADDGREFIRSLAHVDAVYDGMRSSNEINAKVVADQVLARTLDASTLSEGARQALRLEPGQIITYREATERARQVGYFKEVSRQFTTDMEGAAGERRTPPPEPGGGPIPPPVPPL